MSPADPAEMQRESDWVRTMDKMVPVATHVSPLGVGLGVGAAIGLGILMNSGNKHSDDTPRQPNATATPAGTTATPAGTNATTGATSGSNSVYPNKAPAAAIRPPPTQIK